MNTKEKIMALNKKFGSHFKIESEDCINFYYSCMEQGMDLIDIDEYAMLNTLFGYNIGFDNAAKLNRELWERDIETLELEAGEAGKELVEYVAQEIGLDLDFSKWRTEKVEAYCYY